jgi:hypothetical protein
MAFRDDFESGSNFEKIKKTKRKVNEKFSKNKEKEIRIEKERKVKRKLKDITNG